MNPVQYIIINKSLAMSTGKAAAQAAHASQLGLLTHVDNDTTKSPYNSSIVNRWMMGGHYAKVVLEADDLTVAERYLNDRGFKTALVIDEGRTEIEPMTPTAIGTGIVDKDQGHVRATFGEFALYSDSDPRDPEDLLTPEALRKLSAAEDAAIFGWSPSPREADAALGLDDSDPTGDLEGPGFGRVPDDWLTEGAARLAALRGLDEAASELDKSTRTLIDMLPSPAPGFVSKDAVETRHDMHRIREMFRRVRDRLGESRLDEDSDPSNAGDEVVDEPPFPWPSTIRQT